MINCYAIFDTRDDVFKYGVHWLKVNAQLYFSRGEAEKDIQLQDAPENLIVIKFTTNELSYDKIHRKDIVVEQ